MARLAADAAHRGASTLRPLFDGLVSTLIAGLVIAGFSIVRAGLDPQLGGHSPYMLYVAAVLIAAFARSGFCGLLVLIGSGLVGFYFFVEPQDDWGKNPGAVAALGLFWLVGGLVLVAAHELRRQVNATFLRFRQRLAQEAESPQPDRAGSEF